MQFCFFFGGGVGWIFFFFWLPDMNFFEQFLKTKNIMLTYPIKENPSSAAGDE